MDFTIPPDLEDVRRRVAAFVQTHALPLEPKVNESNFEAFLGDLREEARRAALWTPHLPPEWGGLGLGALGMALVSQELGVSALAPFALNCMAPDEGNMHLLLHAGTEDQKRRYLKPLANGTIRSCFAMTERDVASSDPTQLRTTATRDADGWILNGEKWFITGANGAAFAIVLARTEEDDNADPRTRHTLFLVDAGNPGWHIVREIPVMGTHAPGGHCEVRLLDCRVASDAVLGQPGEGLKLSQARLGPARLAHAMRWIGVAQRALDIATERAMARQAFAKELIRHEAVAWMLADSAIDLYAGRLMVLHAAWKIETSQEFRQEVSIVKVHVAEALGRVVDRAIQICGSLGYSGDLPLERFYRDARAARLYDGPSEVHRMVIARNLAKAMATEGTTSRSAGGPA
ncbi:MAG TPA: acyl-CoA dehydrogenase family protein [Actinomycetota bacterium]|nr:acyl-CoA dehydrogenase family protein [Actinomycetota bacterium]